MQLVHAIQPATRSPVLRVSLGAGHALFGSAETSGWRLWDTRTLELVHQLDAQDGSMRFVLPLHRTSLVFLVGGPPSPLYSPNKVSLYDLARQTAVTELEFSEDVLGIACRRDRLVVALRRRIAVFALGESDGATSIWREGTHPTGDNPRGLIALATAPGSTLLAFPGRQTGHVQLVRLPPLDLRHPPRPPSAAHDASVPPYPAVAVIVAHMSALAALAINPSGTIIATASRTGTLVRVWDGEMDLRKRPTGQAVPLRELRRGTDVADIFDIALRSDGGALAVSSDKGTIHVWQIDAAAEAARRKAEEDAESRTSTLSMLKPFLPRYFSSEWSHSQFRLPPPAVPLAQGPSFLASTSGDAPPPTVEDDICICTWIDADPSPVTPTPIASHALRKGKARAAPEPLRPPPVPGPMQLVAITQSGGWYRLAIGDDSAAPAAKARGTGLSSRSEGHCQLVEYRRWGADDWD